jgi:signal recognition particle subunit SRP54
MTLKERKFPALLNTSRKIRIAKGSGTDIADVNKMVKQFGQMQKTLKKVSGDKMQKRMKQLQQMKGKLPPGFLDQLPPDFR